MTSSEILTLVSSGGYGITALAIIAAVYLYRQKEAETKASHEIHVRLLETVLPLSAKLAEGVLAVERLATRRE